MMDFFFPVIAGIETEYGIVRSDTESSDPVIESMELIRSYKGSEPLKWNYSEEDPSMDARGFHAEGLAQDREEEEFTRSDHQRFFSFREMKSDRILPNGARFYNDHTHPEYSTPECHGLFDLLAQDRAGILVMRMAKKNREEQLAPDGRIALYRNNTDYHGHSYGCHENYLLPREIPFERIVSHLLPFLVARTILVGAGKYSTESSERSGEVRYQISQRADFMEALIGVDTMHNRPLVNSRDEPHARTSSYRRLHLIVGDANMSEWQTAMKVGMTRLVLGLLLRDISVSGVAMENPLLAIREISRSLYDQKPVSMENGTDMTALEILESYMHVCQGFSHNDKESSWVLGEWSTALEDFRKDPSLLSDRVDWIAKKELFDSFRQEQSLASDDPWLQSLDLAYHDLDPENGLFWEMESSGAMRRLTREEDVLRAIDGPPSQGRPRIRSAILSLFGDRISEAGWERIRFKDGSLVDLPLFLKETPEDMNLLEKKVRSLKHPGDLASLFIEKPFSRS
jgi:proteasome accessory factor A